MEFINFIIAIIALVIAVLAYRRSGGGTIDLRQSTATMLSKFGKALRKEEVKEEKEETEKKT